MRQRYLSGLILAAAAISPGTPAIADGADLLALQPHAISLSGFTTDGTETRLINLNPTVGRWYLLSATKAGQTRWSHLEVPPNGAPPELSTDGILIRTAGRTVTCNLDDSHGPFAGAKVPRAQLCGTPILVLHTRPGWESPLEAAADLIRNSLGSVGEAMLGFYKTNLHDDTETAKYGGSAASTSSSSGPPDADVETAYKGQTANSTSLGIFLSDPAPPNLILGQWYRARNFEGIWASIATPEALAGSTAVPTAQTGARAMAYFLAIDLSSFTLGYATGTEHPGVEWSHRAAEPHPGPGPDGIADISPLERPATIPPWALDRLAAAFSGGFQRKHAAFRPGAEPPGTTNGAHYGIIENGIVESRLQPGLATIIGRTDGTVEIETLDKATTDHPPADIVFARQNGLPLIASGRIGDRVSDPLGNWSGDADGHLLSLRSAACIVETSGTRWLVYAVFTAATPPTMARSLLAYKCQDAIHLDMNSPAFAYGALIRSAGGPFISEPLFKPMNAAQPPHGTKFVTEAEHKDFFWIVRKP